MNILEEQFKEEYDFPRFDQKVQPYIIASTPRSGSHMLGHLLKETGCFGYPLEYLHPNHFPRWQKRFSANDIMSTIESLQRYRTSPNGVFGAKLHFKHTKVCGGASKLPFVFPNAKYILLTRKRILPQAVSHAIASQNGVWFDGIPPKPGVTLEYDHDLIDAMLRKLLDETNAWRYALSSLGLPYIEIAYEDVLEDIPKHIKSIASFLDVDIPEDAIPKATPTKKQSKPVNKEWIEQFILENKGQEPVLKLESNQTRKLISLLLLRAKKNFLK